jgi:two-component system sensor histidine kinase/response regulator
MDGIETARQILSLGLSPAPHLVIITADSSEQLLERATAAGIRDVLLKPVNASLLFDSAIRLIGGAQGESLGQLTSPALADPRLSAIEGARVLLVEDNELNQEVASELLTGAGLLVDLAEDGAEAVNKVREGAYDIVLMDMHMPVMDGATATQAIRKLAEHSDLPIVAMTANAMPADRQKCLAAGMVDFVAKPIEPDELWEALLRWVQPKHPVRSGRLVAQNAIPNSKQRGIFATSTRSMACDVCSARKSFTCFNAAQVCRRTTACGSRNSRSSRHWRLGHG